jgi:Tripartite tricarboxylate transporter TctB family
VLRIKSPQDVGAAIVFIAIGLGGLYFGRDLAFGSSHNMGPGYFPIILSWIIVAIGVIVGVKALSIQGPPIEPVQLRPITIIIASILVFGYLIDYVGLALTAALVTLLTAFARRGVNLVETLLLAAGLGIFCVLVFVYGLSQPFPAWWGR